jgi:hypothetical protein
VQPLFVRQGSEVRASKNAGRKKSGGEASDHSRAALSEPFNSSPLRAAFSFLRSQLGRRRMTLRAAIFLALVSQSGCRSGCESRNNSFLKL